MSVFRTRRRDLFDHLPADVTTVALTPGPTLRYFTGYQFDRTAWGEKSPFLCVVTDDDGIATVLPELEIERAGEVLPGEFFPYTDDGDAPADAVAALASETGLSAPLGVDYSTMRLQELTLLDVDTDSMVDIGPTVTERRARKDQRERELYREAASITDDILRETLDQLSAGMQESTVEALLKIQTLKSDADAFGSGVVTSGPRTAINYTDTTDRRITDGDLVLIDMGVVYEGYYTDVTRTVVVGESEEQFTEVHDVVREAASRARRAAEPGMTAHELDRVARDVIEEAGYGDQFVHGLGHGIGLDSHEAPVLDQANETVLEEGHVVTIEPGIYIEGVGGVRIEDDVLLTDDGAEVLTELERSIDLAQ